MTKERKQAYQTLFILCAGLALIAWRFHNLYVALISGALLVMGLLSPVLLTYITTAWLRAGEGVGAVISRVLLSVIFILILSPLAILYRLFVRKEEENPNSYFKDRKHLYTPADMDNMF